MEPQVGLVSGKLEEKEYGYKPGSRVYAGPDWGWQTQESYQKTVKMRRGGAFFDFMSALGEPIKQNLAPLAQQLAPVAEAVSGVVQATPLVGPFTEALGTTTETLRQEAVQRGLDPRFGDVAVMAGEELVTAGLGKTVKMLDKVLPPPGVAPQLVTAGAAPIPPVQIKPVVENGVFKLTITKPERLAPGIREGIAKDPDIAKQLTKRASDILKQENRLTTWREFGGVRAAKNIKKAQADVYSKKSTMPQLVQDDPIAYRVAEYKDAAKINLEQHHLFTKAQSSAFVDRMQELIEKGIADQDDLVAMGEYAKHLGAAMGDVNSNMFNMHPKPHNIFHTQMRKAGQEVKPDVLMQQLRKAKNADELMDKFHEYIVDNVIPNKTAAKEAQAAWEIANPDIYGVQEASAMDLFIQELRKRGS